MGAPFSQASSLQAPFFPMMATQPGPAQPPGPQQLPGTTPMVLQPHDQTQFSYNFNIMQSAQSLPGMQPIQMEPVQNLQHTQNFHNLQPMPPAPGINPYPTPVMAIILPNYPTFTTGYTSMYPPSTLSMMPQAPITMTGFAPGVTPAPQPMFQAQTSPLNTQNPLGHLLCSPRASSSVGDEEEEAGPRALFSSSRSSSPLQLNLLQEELPKPSEGQSSTGLNHAESLHEQHANEVSLLSPVMSNHSLLVCVDMQTVCSFPLVFTDCRTFALIRAITPVTLGTMTPSLHPVSCLTCCCRRIPGQAPDPTSQGPDQGSLEAPWDLDLDLAPMEPPPHTLVREENTHAYNTHMNNQRPRHFSLM